MHPFWIRANGCGTQVSYPIHGGGSPGSTSTRSSTWRVPYDGRIVAVGGHLHGGARNMWLSQPRCGGRRLLDNAPRFGMPNHLYYRARPILHEPGPVDTRYFLSRTGIPVRAGERLRITGAYEGSLPHPRVMAIMHVYVARDSTIPRRCKRLPADRRELEKPGRVRTSPPLVSVPLNAVRPDGRTYVVQTPATGGRRIMKKRARVELRQGLQPGHVSVPLGASITWRFSDVVPHNVLIANGPSLIGTPDAQPRGDAHVALPRARPLRALLLPAPDDDARGRRRAGAGHLAARTTRGPRERGPLAERTLLGAVSAEVQRARPDQLGACQAERNQQRGGGQGDREQRVGVAHDRALGPDDLDGVRLVVQRRSARAGGVELRVAHDLGRARRESDGVGPLVSAGPGGGTACRPGRRTRRPGR